MKRYIDINDDSNVKMQLTTDELPLCVSNDLSLNNQDSLFITLVNDENNTENTVYAYIAQDEGHLFFQPNNEISEGEKVSIFHNDEYIEKSVWLKSNDELQIKNKIIHYIVSGDKIQFKVKDKKSLEFNKQLNIVPPPTPHHSSNNININDESKSDKKKLKVESKPSNKKIKKNGLIIISIALFLLACFILFAETATIKIEPGYDDIQLIGMFPTIKIKERFILISGQYDLSVMKKDYEPLKKSLTIDNKNNKFSYTLKEKPGRVQFNIDPKSNNKIYINNVLLSAVENADNNFEDAFYEIDEGEHYVLIENSRYKSFEQVIKVEGKNKFQQFDFKLVPNWGKLTITPMETDVIIKIYSELNPKEVIAINTNEIELISGHYIIKVNKEKFKERIEKLSINAGENIKLEIAALIPEDATFNISSTPENSLIRIDGQYYGKTPQSVKLTPNVEHEIKLSLSGYKDVSQVITLNADELIESNYELEKIKGLVFISVIPDKSELLINGKKQKKTSGKFDLSGNNHTIVARAQGYKTQTKKINVTNYSKNINFKLEKIVSKKPKIIKEKNLTKNKSKVKIQNTNYINSIGQKMILVKPTEFTMGSKKNEAGRGSNERLHKVKLSYSYFLSDKEVSNKQFKQFLASHNSGSVSNASLNNNQQPVVNVTWDTAAKFSNWLSKKEGLNTYYKEVNHKMVPNIQNDMNTGYRLPYEAEWVLAAKGQTQKKYAWIGTFPPINRAGNFADESSRAYVSNIIEGYNDQNGVSSAIGSYSKNSLGFYDLGGNVSEWCADFYSPNYGLSGLTNKTVFNPKGPAKGIHKVVKDSSWRDASITELRLSYRSYSKKKAKDIGFRLARNAK